MSNVSHVIPIVMLIHIWVWVNCSVIDTCDARACLFPPPYPCWHDTKYGSDPGERKRTCHQINRKSQEDSQTRGEATKNAIASALLPTAVVYVAHLTEGRSFSVRSYGGNFRFRFVKMTDFGLWVKRKIGLTCFVKLSRLDSRAFIKQKGKIANLVPLFVSIRFWSPYNLIHEFSLLVFCNSVISVPNPEIGRWLLIVCLDCHVSHFYWTLISCT